MYKTTGVKTASFAASACLTGKVAQLSVCQHFPSNSCYYGHIKALFAANAAMYSLRPAPCQRTGKTASGTFAGYYTGRKPIHCLACPCRCAAVRLQSAARTDKHCLRLARKGHTVAKDRQLCGRCRSAFCQCQPAALFFAGTRK